MQVRFGAVYGIVGNHQPTGDTGSFPVGASDAQIQAVADQLKSKASSTGITLEALIVTRKGGAYHGIDGLTPEIRLILTGDDATALRQDREKILMLQEGLERLVDEKSQFQQKYRAAENDQLLTQRRTFLKKKAAPKDTAIPADLLTDLSGAEKRLAEFQKTYNEIVTPVLSKAASVLRGYVSVNTLTEQLASNTFDVETGGDVKPDTERRAFWWHRPDGLLTENTFRDDPGLAPAGLEIIPTR